MRSVARPCACTLRSARVAPRDINWSAASHHSVRAPLVPPFPFSAAASPPTSAPPHRQEHRARWTSLRLISSQRRPSRLLSRPRSLTTTPTPAAVSLRSCRSRRRWRACCRWRAPLFTRRTRRHTHCTTRTPPLFTHIALASPRMPSQTTRPHTSRHPPRQGRAPTRFGFPPPLYASRNTARRRSRPVLCAKCPRRPKRPETASVAPLASRSASPRRTPSPWRHVSATFARAHRAADTVPRCAHAWRKGFAARSCVSSASATKVGAMKRSLPTPPRGAALTARAAARRALSVTSTTESTRVASVSPPPLRARVPAPPTLHRRRRRRPRRPRPTALRSRGSNRSSLTPMSSGRNQRCGIRALGAKPLSIRAGPARAARPHPRVVLSRLSAAMLSDAIATACCSALRAPTSSASPAVRNATHLRGVAPLFVLFGSERDYLYYYLFYCDDATFIKKSFIFPGLCPLLARPRRGRPLLTMPTSVDNSVHTAIYPACYATLCTLLHYAPPRCATLRSSVRPRGVQYAASRHTRKSCRSNTPSLYAA